jgi:hypothetical protein
MEFSDTQANPDSTILDELAAMRDDVNDLRSEINANAIDLNASFDRIDVHLKDITQIMAKTNQALT